MMTTRGLEDTLPFYAPNCPEHFQNALHKKFAIYTLVTFNNAELLQLEQVINSGENSTSNSRLATPSAFAVLKDAYEHHLRLRDQDQDIHPLYFIVADRKDYAKQGALGVYLAVSTLKSSNIIGVCRCGVDMADSMGANLEIGNMDWMDFKEMEQESWGGENSYENPRYQDESPLLPAPDLDSHVFGWYSLVEKAVPINTMLEPGWSSMAQGELHFQNLANLSSSSDPLSQIRRQHSFECLRRDRLHRQLLLIAEKEDADSEEGLSIWRLSWDGDLHGYSYDPSSYEGRTQEVNRVRAIMPELEFVKKVRVPEALDILRSLD